VIILFQAFSPIYFFVLVTGTIEAAQWQYHAAAQSARRHDTGMSQQHIGANKNGLG